MRPRAIESRPGAPRPLRPARAARAAAAALVGALVGPLVGAAPARGVLLAVGDAATNTQPPPASATGRARLPFEHLARRGPYSAVYLGHRWVLTAAHVGAFPVEIGGVVGSPIDATRTRLRNEDGSASDLLAFRIDSDPHLPVLPIARARPPRGARVWLVGQGLDRGARAAWRAPGGAAFEGFRWAATRAMRWGTNRIEAGPFRVATGGVHTHVLAMDFTPPGAPGATRFEAQATTGDSGGALFARRGDRFELAGILVVRTFEKRQPRATSFYGNRTLAADLSLYRAQLVALVRPACSDEIDDDGDGAIDYPADPDCASPEDDREDGLGPGLAPAP